MIQRKASPTIQFEGGPADGGIYVLTISSAWVVVHAVFGPFVIPITYAFSGRFNEHGAEIWVMTLAQEG